MRPRIETDVLTRRRLLLLISAGAGLGLAAACGPTTPSAQPPVATTPPKPTTVSAPPTTAPAPAGAPAAAPTTPPAPTAVAATAGQPRRGGTLTFGQNVEVASGGQAGASALDGHNVSPAPLSALWLGYDTLMAYDENNTPQPMLAESWDVASDFKTIKLNLRKGVQFHTGREFTADDVKFNLLRVRQPNIGPQFTNMSRWWTSIETPDKYTVVLTSEQPRPGMFDLFEMFNMVNKDLVESPDYLTRSGSTGPFKFVEYAQGDFIHWTRNPNYWQSGRPYLDDVRVRFFGDAQSMVVQLEANATHVADSPPARDAARLKSDSAYRVLVNDLSGQYWVMVANTTAGATANKKVRQALNFAADRKRFIDTALAGVGDPKNLPWLTNSPAYEADKNTRYTFDLDRAKALIAESGETEVSIDFVFNSVVPEIATFAQLYQADLAKIGVRLNIKGVERSVYNDMAAKFQYGLLMSSSGFANLDPATLPLVSRYWDPNNNLAGMNDNAQYKQVVTAVSVEPDAAKRKTLLSNLNDVILDESFSIPVASAKHVTALRANVNGFRWRAVESVDYAGVWLGA